MLSREQILCCTFPSMELVEVPEWFGHVYVRAMSAADLDAFEAENKASGGINVRARLVIASVCDEQGKLLFTRQDLAAISAMPFRPIDQLASVALRLCGWAPGGVDELEKNSEAAQSGSSPSGSPSG